MLRLLRLLIEFLVVPTYTGTTTLDSFTVTYEMVGTEEPQIGSFVMSSGQINAPEQQNSKTTGGDVAVSARVTDVF